MLRNFEKCFENHKKQLIDHYDCDIYLNLWDVVGAGHVGHKYNFFEEDVISNEQKEKILNLVKPKEFYFESLKDYETVLNEFRKKINFFESSQPFTKNILSMCYKIKRANDMVENSLINYDVVVRMRTDIVLNNKCQINDVLDNNTFYCQSNGSWNDSTIGDLFSYGTPKIMSIFSKLYDNLEEMWKTIEIYNAPEFLLYYYLTTNSIKIEKTSIYVDKIM